jgi:apolipoprotein N-acyltransferase
VNAAFEKRLLIVWLALSAISVLSWWIGSSHGREAFIPDAAITFSVLAIALIKVRVIMREFMEVRHAPVLLCRLTDIWLSLTAVTLLGTYFVGMAFSTK